MQLVFRALFAVLNSPRRVFALGGAAFAFALTLFVVSAAAWLTHVITTIKSAEYLLLLVGALVAPVGVIHGIGIWLGAW